MLNIYFISNDDRIDRLIEHFQPFLKTRIRKASDFDHGLKEVFENRPSAVFIQSNIGSVSGETVARHIKSLLGADSPRIIFMGEERPGKKKGDSWCDEWVPIGDTDEQILKGFQEVVARYYPKEWADITAEIEKSSRTYADKDSECLAAENGDGCLSPPGCEDIVHVSADTGAEPGGEAATDDSPAFTGDENLSKEKASTADESCPSQFLILETFAAHEDSPEAKAGKRGVRVWVLLLFALVAAGAAVYCWKLFVQRKASGNRPPVTFSAPVPAAGAIGAVTTLPSCIRQEWRDSVYSKTHPGWERYVSPDYDFRVYRDKSVIKALQVLSLGSKGIPEELPRSLLKEFGYTGEVPAGVNESKDGFVVCRVVIKGIAEIVTYRAEGRQTVSAMVVELS